jgi:hypothetical protein
MQIPLAAFGLSDETTTKLLLSVGLPAVTTVASFLIGRWWGNYRAQRQWTRKEFYDRIIVSLNLLNDERLRIRTVMERPLDVIFPNAIAAQKIREAALKTTADDPMLPMKKDDCWFLLNFVLNAIAEHFSSGVVKLDAGVPVTCVTYALCLTCEQVGEERIRKIRALLIRKEHLENFPYADTMPQLENHWHSDRIVTLRKCAAAYQARPEQFLHLEACV